MNKKIIILFSVLVVLICFYSFPRKINVEELPNTNIEEPLLETIPKIENAIYLTGSYLTSEYRFEKIFFLIEETEINAVVIDVKDFSGKIYLNIDNEVLDGALQLWVETDKIIEKLHDKGVYVIGRVVVFEDPILSNKKPELAIKDNDGNIWKGYDGLPWTNPSSKEVWDYNILVAKEALNLGFDEINFDYIRFPTDGNLKIINYTLEGKTKIETMEEFYIYLRNNLKEANLSIDLFGLTTLVNDIGVGQNIEIASRYFNYVCPMVYPSHYADGFAGYLDPSEYPYEVVYKSLDEANKKVGNIRPWLQAFNLMGYEYKKEEIQAQIKATKDALGENYNGYMLWNSKNEYFSEYLKD
ncbi:MAG: putative glycoside hydrolase [Candidatus Pacebacteria bacterium]|nr:putative glycoside hydrolase [Candidatus Paceibacterota bacterium]